MFYLLSDHIFERTVSVVDRFPQFFLHYREKVCSGFVVFEKQAVTQLVSSVIIRFFLNVVTNTRWKSSALT